MKMDFAFADRLAALPPYLFAEIDRAKARVKERGVDIISLGIGDPDLPTPDFIIEALCQAARKPANHQYPSYAGMPSYREAVAGWYKERFGVELDPAEEVVSLIGSKEGIANFPLAFVNPGDKVLVSQPGYPVYAPASQFAGGEVVNVDLKEENDFLPDLDAIDNDTWKQARLFFINYPNNPTSATAPDDFYRRLIEKAKEFEVIIAHDAAYTEIYYDPSDKPRSILEFEGARDVAIEFHSLSKTYNMTGWRVGMAVGNPKLVKGMGTIKENIDSGIFQAVQEAGITALTRGEPAAQANREIYKERLAVVTEALEKVGVSFRRPKATFYVWARTPGNESSKDFAMRVLEETGVVVTPGNGFGAAGEGYFRISLTVHNDRLMEAVDRIAGKL
jgi:LL-diaminopimelate aminotransferase